MRAKTYGYGYSVPADRNEKNRITFFANAYNARARQSGQHIGPLTWATLRVLHALLWEFHNAKSGRCFPSYESIAAKARCARSTVHRAIGALEKAGILTWQQRIVRHGNRVLRTSNTYRFRSTSENRSGTENQDVPIYYSAPPRRSNGRPEPVAPLRSVAEQIEMLNTGFLGAPILRPG